MIVLLIENKVKCESLSFLPLWQSLHPDELCIREHILVGFQVYVMLQISSILTKVSQTS